MDQLNKERYHSQIYFFCFLLILGLSTLSCNKEVRGCTDDRAANYNPAADTYDNSCYYYCAGCIEWKSSFIYQLETDNINYVKVYIDTMFVGGSYVSNIVTNTDCDPGQPIMYYSSRKIYSEAWGVVVNVTNEWDSLITSQYHRLRPDDENPIRLEYY